MPSSEDYHTEQIDFTDCPHCGMCAGLIQVGLFLDIADEDIQNDPELGEPTTTWWECRFCGYTTQE